MGCRLGAGQPVEYDLPDTLEFGLIELSFAPNISVSLNVRAHRFHQSLTISGVMIVPSLNVVKTILVTDREMAA